MRLFVVAAGADALEGGGRVVEGLRSKEELGAGVAFPRQLEGEVQVRLAVAGGEAQVVAAPLGVEAGGDGGRLDQRGLAASVLADEEGHTRCRLKSIGGEGGNRERVSVLVPIACHHPNLTEPAGGPGPFAAHDRSLTGYFADRFNPVQDRPCL